MPANFHNTTKYLVRKLRARLRRTSPLHGGGAVNLWCEIIGEMQSDFNEKNLLRPYLNNLIISMLEEQYDNTQLFLFWLETDFSKNYLEQLQEDNPSIDFDEIEFPKIYYLTLSDTDKEDLASVILDRFYYEDNFDFEQENKKGKYISLKYEVGQ